jgi:N-methylhydantoinase B
MASVLQSVDPITFQILSHKLHQITKEMGATLERVGGTVNTTQQKDYMAGLYRANGEILSAGDSMGWQVACAGFAVKRIMERFADTDVGIYPGDVFLVNDPYVAAIHQSDVYMIAPIHFSEKLVGWSATFVHVADVGALSPGGNSPGAREVYHEGLRIPGLKLVERGKLRKDVFETILNMTRQPAMVGLDLKCEIAANHVANLRMQEMYDQYGPELVDAIAAEMIHYSETLLRRRIDEIADGAWSEDGLIQAGDERWRIHLTLKKKGDCLIFDFTGTEKQANKGINLPYHATFGSCYEALLGSLAYDLPKNHGIFKTMDVIAPPGTMVNVQLPGPVSMSTTSSGAMVKYFLARSVLMQMLATSEAWNKKIMAVTAYGRTVRHAGLNQSGKYYVSGLGSELALGGGGARAERDGVHSGGSHQSAANVEWMELNFPLLFLFRRHATDAAGAGQFRGGVGGESALTIHDAPEKKLKGVAMGVSGLRNSGQGMFGGFPGAPSVLYYLQNSAVNKLIASGTAPVELAALEAKPDLLSYAEFDLREDDVLYLRTASGGGYGDALERAPEAVVADVREGYVSRQAARDCYGVVLDETGAGVDRIETEKLRASMKLERAS